MIAFYTGTVTSFVNVLTVPFDSVLQKSYFESGEYLEESDRLLSNLTQIMTIYKNEEHVLNGGTIREDEWRHIEEALFFDFQDHSTTYNPNLSQVENYERFKQEYADELSREREKIINRERREYHRLLQSLKDTEAPLFYASDGTNVYTNTTENEKQQFETYPAYLLFENYDQKLYPEETRNSEHLHWIMEDIESLNPENTVVYLAFTEEFLQPKLAEWERNSEFAVQNLLKLTIFVPGFIFSFIYLAFVTGRRSFKDPKVHFNAVDHLYNDINIGLCILLSSLIIVLLDLFIEVNKNIILLATVPIAILVFVLILSQVKHIKNKTFFKHSLMYRLIAQFANFIGDVYKNGNLAVKTILIVMGYPLFVALTFFMFPITIGIAAWFALKKIKSFKAIQVGVEEIKAGNLHYRIDVQGNGEFAELAENINSITDGLENAVENELKSERLKTELITNVSHDIRTPLTSIITYVDLLKNEKDPAKVESYIEVLDQKTKRLKNLTDNLFEAAKASSGDIPVHLEKIDIVSLVNQGLGEVDDKITEKNLEFKLKSSTPKVCVMADGRLLWRSIENVLSNILKYALEGSRVYIDIAETGSAVRLTFKNISANELNISADELMERFKRGDESRSSEGSGLGLSIAKSLIEIQQGKLTIQIDGDLFKTIIDLPNYIE